MKTIASGLASARSMGAGHGEFKFGLYADPFAAGASLDARARFDETWYGFATAHGGYDFMRREMFGEAYIGAGAEW